MEEIKTVMCCFCGKSLAHKDSVEIEISTANSEESQCVFSHKKCLKKLFHKDVPIGIDIDEEN